MHTFSQGTHLQINVWRRSAYPIQPPETFILPGFGQAVDWPAEPGHLIEHLRLETDFAKVEWMLEHFRYNACNLEKRTFSQELVQLRRFWGRRKEGGWKSTHASEGNVLYGAEGGGPCIWLAKLRIHPHLSCWLLLVKERARG